MGRMMGIVAPGVMLCGTGVSVSMGWIFVVIGRQHRRVSHVKWTAGFLAAAVVTMFVLIFLVLQVSNPPGIGG